MHHRGDKKVATLSAALISLVLSACGGGGGYGGGDTPPPPPPPPASTITLKAPVPAGVSVNRTVALDADVVAPAGITRVEFLVDGTVVGTDTATPFSFAWDTATIADGAHDVTARVTDGASRTVTSTAVAVLVRNTLVLKVALTPGENIPRPNSGASGTGEITFNLASGTVSGGVTTVGFLPINAHIHGAYAGLDGGAVVQFVRNDTDAQRWQAPAGAVLTADQVKDLLAGKLYVNVHSEAVPTGEIRAQFRPENIKVVFTDLGGAGVVPAVATDASAIAATTVDSLAMTATVHATLSGVQNTQTVQVRKGAANANVDAVLIPLERDPAKPGRWISATVPITAADLDAFRKNGWYIEVRTQDNPAGLVRGQITPVIPPTITQLQATVFGPSCSGCHNGSVDAGGPLPASMNLTSAAASFRALVDVPSREKPELLRVKPFSPDDSYLVHKIEGRAGIAGVRMPAGCSGATCLDQPTIDQVSAWIGAGVPGAEVLVATDHASTVR